MRAARRLIVEALAVIALLVPGGAAVAQMALPGAVAPTPSGATMVPKASHAGIARKGDHEGGEPIVRGVAVAIPGITSFAGKTLTLDGAGSQISFAPGADKTVAVSRLALSGEKLSNGHETCHFDAPAMPLALTGLGRPSGLDRFRVELPACPITFDVLDGAALVAPLPAACDFIEADCRVDPAGLWGPVPGDVGPDKVKSLERSRAAAESAVRLNYKALTASTKDRRAIMVFAHDQAQFSSTREEVCRDYAEEGRHGFCATKLTEARAALLHEEVAAAAETKLDRKAKRRAAK